MTMGLPGGILTSHSRKCSGVTNNINDGFVTFTRASRTFHCGRFLALPHLNGMQPLLMLLVASVSKKSESVLLVFY